MDINKNNNKYDINNTIMDTIMEFRTIQATVIKNLFESIKEILMDVNMVFDLTSIKCTAIDGNKVACVHFSLDTSKFEYYSCNNTLVIGVNMNSLHKLIKPITTGDTITMYATKNNRHRLCIVIENVEKRTRTTSYLKLLDIDQDIISIPHVEFDNIITIPCVDFQRHCKDMMMISDKVTFICREDMFSLECSGDFADLVIEIRRQDNNIIVNSDTTCNVVENNDEHGSESINTGTFSLKYINLFIKSSTLCSNVEIYLKKGYPLILVYRIGGLGKIQFCLAPEHDDT